MPAMSLRYKDIAEKTGLAVSTVAMILTGHGKTYNAATMRRVRQAAKEMGFRPSLAGRSLRTGRSYLVGVLVPERLTPLMSDISWGVMAALGDTEYAPLTFTLEETEGGESRAISKCARRNVDGLLAGIESGEDQSKAVQQLKAIERRGKPVIEFCSSLLDFAPSIDLDFETAGRMAARHLLDNGHRRIALITCEGYESGGDAGLGRRFMAWRHFAGCRDALAEAGVTPRVITVPVNSTGRDWIASQIAAGYQALSDVFRDPSGLTAVICVSDEIAIGVVSACQAGGYHVPSRLSIVSYRMGRAVSGGIDSCAHDIGDVARQAMDMLLRRISGDTVESVRVQPVCSFGRTTGPVKSR